jgi:ATP-dependent HslUV protease subunit HslV
MKSESDRPIWRSTTILSVRKGDVVALGGDGQVSYGNTIMKSDTKKIRWMLDDRVLVGFAGSTADAFALMERFETKLKDYPGNMPRAATELARDWRTDRILRKLEAMMITVDAESSRATDRRHHRHRLRRKLCGRRRKGTRQAH